MSKGFSPEVKQALKNIYYDTAAQRGAEGFSLLEKASAAGDGDATCILARCLCGRQYVWPCHGFPEDDDRATRLLHKSVEQGSALGVLICMRTGELTPELVRSMPFSSLQEAFNTVLEIAEGGDGFCQYVVGNTYFWWDFIEIQGTDASSFPTPAAYRQYLIENISKCESWFQKAFHNGMYAAADNLYQYYTKGDEDLIAPQPHKAKDLWKTGAELGYPIDQHFYADDLSDAGKIAEAAEWYKKGAQNGQPECWFHLGELYEEGKGVPKDLSYAAECYTKAVTPTNCSSHRAGAAENLGAMYYEGKGVVQDYARAFSLFMESQALDSDAFTRRYLGKCYFYGRGTQKDYQQARSFLEPLSNTEDETFYILGTIYCQGLGVPEDIAKGAGYLKKAKDFPAAKEELGKYKKTLFGKWIRR